MDRTDTGYCPFTSGSTLTPLIIHDFTFYVVAVNRFLTLCSVASELIRPSIFPLSSFSVMLHLLAMNSRVIQPAEYIVFSVKVQEIPLHIWTSTTLLGEMFGLHKP